MLEIRLKPISPPPALDEEFARQILLLFYESIFEPIVKTIREAQNIYYNATNSAISKALLIGAIQYSNGVFKGKFNAKISRQLSELGANYDKRIEGYRLNIANIPIYIQIAIAQSKNNSNNLVRDVLGKIDNLNYQDSLDLFDAAPSYRNIIASVDNQFTKTTAKYISVSPDFTDEIKKRIAIDYSNNLKLDIKGFLDKEILELRKIAEKAVFAGYRPEYLQKKILERFNISRSKAKFLAQQESNLLTSKYKEARYQNSGITKYQWSTSHDERVRDDHRALNGKIFLFDDPPIVNKDNGKRANPGEDFGCRCKAIPILG